MEKPSSDHRITVCEAPAGPQADRFWPQLLKMENSYRAEIGEPLLSERQQEQLRQAVQAGRIVFFIARQGTCAVGMCSVVTAFSTFACAGVGTFEDFFVEPPFRRQGVARLLAGAARQWCAARGVSSLTVCCAPCDEAMYRSLGFSLHLGTTYACLSG